MSSLNVSILSSSSSSDIVYYQSILRSLVATLGLIILICGILGNLLNILTLITLGYYKHNACSFYILSRSIFDLLILSFGLGTRILSQSFQIDWTLTSDIWCKLRVPIIYINTLSSYTFLCLQSIDAFLVTSLSVTVRQKSTVQTARYLLGFFISFWIVEELPYLFFQELIINPENNKPMCLTKNSIYGKYRTYFIYLFLTTIIPIILIILFDYLTYRHLRIHAFEKRLRLLSILARQMTTMTLFHITAVLLFQAPFAIAQCYFLTMGISKEPLRAAQEMIVQQCFNVLGYGIYATSFYCYIIASKRFREQVFNIFSFSQRRNNRIQPQLISPYPL